MKYFDLIGKRFGNLLVIKRNGSDKHRDTLWETLCDCGKSHTSRGSTLRKGTSISCGCRMSFRKRPKDRFWEYVKKTDSCWEWKGPIMKVGYGCFSINNRPYYAHRFSYEVHIGKIPKNKLVCHSCDNRKCVNPDHFFLGSHKENTADMIIKNRNCKGVKMSTHKLNEEDVMKIKSLRKEGKFYRELGEMFGVSYSVARRICLNKTWKHIP